MGKPLENGDRYILLQKYGPGMVKFFFQIFFSLVEKGNNFQEEVTGYCGWGERGSWIKHTDQKKYHLIMHLTNIHQVSSICWRQAVSKTIEKVYSFRYSLNHLIFTITLEVKTIVFLHFADEETDAWHG